MLLDLIPDSVHQTELDLSDVNTQAEQQEKARLMVALDAINDRYGKGTLKIGSAGWSKAKKAWGMRQERRTPGYTTNWDDIPIARA
jgi:DNA polymerase V